MKISVIVPVYNTAAYLPKCLDSLLAQTLDGIEIIIVNDGSTDGSKNIIEDYARKFPQRIKAFSKPNGGLSDARNFGLKQSTGEFIGFVDSDDYVAPDMFAEMFGLAKKYSAEIAICNLQKVDETGKVTQKITQLPGFPEKIVLKDNPSVFSDISYFACNKIFKKELFEGMEFKTGVHFEDIQLVPQLLLKSKTIAFTEKYHYQYFERADSITKTHTDRGLDILKAVEDVAREYGKSDFRGDSATLKNFKILQGIYSFLAYLAFVKNPQIAAQMRSDLGNFMRNNEISFKDIMFYRRFGKNYLLSLPPKKKIYYLLYFSGQHRLISRLLR